MCVNRFQHVMLNRPDMISTSIPSLLTLTKPFAAVHFAGGLGFGRAGHDDFLRLTALNWPKIRRDAHDV